jgi:hypothetical protein
MNELHHRCHSHSRFLRCHLLVPQVNQGMGRGKAMTWMIWPFLILAGLADAVCDLWRDGKEPLPYFKSRYPIWYNGSRGTGISPYANDGWPWNSDFWHLAKLIREYAWCCAIGVALGDWWLLAIPVFAFVKGKTFFYTYHSI